MRYVSDFDNVFLAQTQHSACSIVWQAHKKLVCRFKTCKRFLFSLVGGIVGR